MQVARALRAERRWVPRLLNRQPAVRGAAHRVAQLEASLVREPPQRNVVVTTRPHHGDEPQQIGNREAPGIGELRSQVAGRAPRRCRVRILAGPGRFAAPPAEPCSAFCRRVLRTALGSQLPGTWPPPALRALISRTDMKATG